MTNSYQNQQGDTGLQTDYLSPEQKSTHDDGAKGNANGEKDIFYS